MKRITLIFLVLIFLIGCHPGGDPTLRSLNGPFFAKPTTADLPSSFQFVESRGENYFIYKDDFGYYLVFKQRSYFYLVFIEYLGKEIPKK